MRLSRSLLPSVSRLAAAAAMAALAAGCDDTASVANSGRSMRPIPPDTLALMEQRGTTKSAPVLIRAYKKEAELEIWKQKSDGRYVYLKSFPMCRWSGQLGPKIREGDRQVPEGFYTITPGQMNPNSNYYLSFNVGYPNAYDRAYGYSGGSIMVHGACSSAGCFSMTDEQIAEIYAIAREAFNGGQKAIQMQSLPFRMTAENLAKHRADPNSPFWHELKDGADHFEVTKQEPTVGVCDKHYVFDSTPVDPKSHLDPVLPCPALQSDPDLKSAVAAKQHQDDTEVAALVEKGVKPVRLVYEDGGQNPSFYAKVGDVSRPEAIALGPHEILLDEKTGKPVVTAEAESTTAKKSPKLAAITNSASAKPNVAASVVQQSHTTAVAQTPVKATLAVADATGSLPHPDAAAAEQPFYKRWFSNPATSTQQAAATAEAGESTSQPLNVPLPPRRQNPAHNSGKPAVSAKPQKPLATFQQKPPANSMASSAAPAQ
jgi:murein L,D-transpeptidase YafK